MYKFKGFISFPQVFTPDFVRNAQGKPISDKKRFTMDLMIPPGDPQIAQIQQVIEAEKANGYPSGAPANLRVCLQSYDEKLGNKAYYDPKFTGYYILSVTAKETDKPTVVDANMQPVTDPGDVYPGAECWLACGITYYAEGQTGVGGWLNGIMLTGGVCPLGRFDNKPTVEQMFADVAGDGTPAPMAPPAAPAQPTPPLAAPQALQQAVAPTPPAPPAPPAPAAPAQLIMTAAANGMTYDQYKAAGWSDEQMIAGGVAQQPTFA